MPSRTRRESPNVTLKMPANKIRSQGQIKKDHEEYGVEQIAFESDGCSDMLDCRKVRQYSIMSSDSFKFDRSINVCVDWQCLIHKGDELEGSVRRHRRHSLESLSLLRWESCAIYGDVVIVVEEDNYKDTGLFNLLIHWAIASSTSLDRSTEWGDFWHPKDKSLRLFKFERLEMSSSARYEYIDGEEFLGVSVLGIFQHMLVFKIFQDEYL